MKLLEITVKGSIHQDKQPYSPDQLNTLIDDSITATQLLTYIADDHDAGNTAYLSQTFSALMTWKHTIAAEVAKKVLANGLPSPSGIILTRTNEQQVWVYKDSSGITFCVKVITSFNQTPRANAFLNIKIPKDLSDLETNDIMPHHLVDGIYAAAIHRLFTRLGDRYP